MAEIQLLAFRDSAPCIQSSGLIVDYDWPVIGKRTYRRMKPRGRRGGWKLRRAIHGIVIAFSETCCRQNQSSQNRMSA